MYFHLPNQPIRTSVEKAKRKPCLLNGKKASLPESDLGKKLKDGKSPRLKSLSSHQYISLERSYAFRGSCFQMSLCGWHRSVIPGYSGVSGRAASHGSREELPARFVATKPKGPWFISTFDTVFLALTGTRVRMGSGNKGCKFSKRKSSKVGQLVSCELGSILRHVCWAAWEHHVLFPFWEQREVESELSPEQRGLSKDMRKACATKERVAGKAAAEERRKERT